MSSILTSDFWLSRMVQGIIGTAILVGGMVTFGLVAIGTLVFVLRQCGLMVGGNVRY